MVRIVLASLALLVALVGCTPTPSQSQPESEPAPTLAPAPDAYEFGNVEPAEDCVKPFRDAARFPADRNVDSFFRTATYTCMSMDEFASALRLFPAALAMTSPASDFDVQVSIQLACDYFDAQREAPVCIEAVTAGIVDERP